VRSTLETLRPQGDFGPVPAWLEWLVRARGHVAEALATAARLEGERGVRWILGLLECDALDREGALGSGYGPTSAARLLGELAPASAAPAMARLLARLEPDSALADCLAVAFRGFGAEALEPLLAARATLTPSEDEDGIRDHLLEAIVSLGVQDPRVSAVVREEFAREPALAAMHFVQLKEREAAPLLSAWVDEQALDIEDESRLSNMDLYDVLDCLEQLTGSLSPAHAALESRIVGLRVAVALAEESGDAAPPWGSASPEDDEDDAEEYEVLGGDDPLDVGAFQDDVPDEAPSYAYPALSPLPPVPLRAVPEQRIGRNDPCHCGSSKKYKRCCWDADHRPPDATGPRPYSAPAP
jgi:hypothetical protein